MRWYVADAVFCRNGHCKTYRDAGSTGAVAHQIWLVIGRVTTLQTEKKSLTFPDEIADNISNKCTFINTKYGCYNNDWVAFQQLTIVNSKC